MPAPLPSAPQTTVLGIACAAALALPAPGHAQLVLENLAAMSAENSRLYMAPVAQGLAYALTAGAFDRPAVLPALHVDLGFRVAAAIPGDTDQRFDVILPATITWQHPSVGSRSYTDPYAPVGGDPSTPSGVGDGPGVVLEPSGAFRQDLVAAGQDPSDYEIQLASGMDLSLVPSATLHLSVGIGMATEVTVRVLPGASVSPDVGAFSGRGIGVKHEISRWLSSPVDLSVGIATQEIEVADYLEASAFEGWLMAGRGLGPVTVYGTAGLRRASVDVAYTARNPAGIPGLPDDGTRIAFSSDLETGLSWGAGVRLQLLLMNVAGQYTMADQNAFSIKVALAFP
jgi:hypothetical protein